MNFVIDIIVTKAMALAEIAEVTDIDKVLSVIRSYISYDAWPIKKTWRRLLRHTMTLRKN